MNISKIIKLTILAFSLFVSLFSASCTYNESPVYSTEDSDTYNCVIYKYEWTPLEDGHWTKRLNIPNINRSIMDNGLVLVYYKYHYDGGWNWVQIPYSTTLYVNGYQYAEEIWAGYSLGAVDIDYVYTNPLDMTPPNMLELKIIIVKL